MSVPKHPIHSRLRTGGPEMSHTLVPNSHQSVRHLRAPCCFPSINRRASPKPGGDLSRSKLLRTQARPRILTLTSGGLTQNQAKLAWERPWPRLTAKLHRPHGQSGRQGDTTTNGHEEDTHCRVPDVCGPGSYAFGDKLSPKTSDFLHARHSATHNREECSMNENITVPDWA